MWRGHCVIAELLIEMREQKDRHTYRQTDKETHRHANRNTSPTYTAGRSDNVGLIVYNLRKTPCALNVGAPGRFA